MEPRLRASPEQFSALIEFMERHGDLSRPQAGAQGRLRGDRLWQDLARLLNSVGGGVEKTHDKWKKVWADWKTKTKKKYLLIRRHASGTGGGPSSRQTLTALEERVVAIIGVSAVVGQASIREQGLNTPSQQCEEPSVQSEGSETQLFLEVPIIPPSTPSPPGLHTSTIPSQTITTQSSEPQLSPSRRQPRTPPRSEDHRTSSSPRSAAATPRRRLQLRARRNRGLTSFDRAASEFVAVEQRRLQREEMRERYLHEREIERMKQETERIEVAREHNQLLRQLGVIAERLLDTLLHNRPSSLPSTDVLPDTD